MSHLEHDLAPRFELVLFDHIADDIPDGIGGD